MPKGVLQSPGVSAAASIFDFGFNRGAGKPLDLLSMYLSSQRTMCSDHKDRVFGLLGLLDVPTLRAPQYLKVDYAKPLSAVLRDSIKAVVTQKGSLSMLNYVMPRREDPELDGLPSWVPVFSERLNLDIDMFELDWEHSADGGKLCKISSHADDNVLAVDGFVIDNLKTVSRPFTESQLLNASVQGELLGACRTLLQQASGSSTPEQDEETIAFTLTGRKTGESPVETATFMGIYRVFTRRAMLDPDKDKMSKGDIGKSMTFSIEIASRCHNRRIYSTEHGFLGLGTWTMQAGDVVAVLYGAMWPVLLRPLADDAYEFIGVSYVKAFMDGEAVKKREQQRDPPTVLCMR